MGDESQLKLIVHRGSSRKLISKGSPSAEVKVDRCGEAYGVSLNVPETRRRLKLRALGAGKLIESKRVSHAAE